MPSYVRAGIRKCARIRALSAKVLGTTGHFNSMAIAFRNPDGTVVVVAQNALDEERPFAFADPDAAERGFKVTLAPRSFNTFVLD